MRMKSQFADDDLHEADRKSTEIDFTGDPGKTIQEPTEDCDINVMMKRMNVKDGSTLPYWDRPGQLYDVDLSDLPDDPTTINNIMRAGELKFMALPAEIRGRFENDPAKLYTFLNDDKNVDEARKLGLLAAPEPPKQPISVRVIPEPPPAAPPAPTAPLAGVS